MKVVLSAFLLSSWVSVAVSEAPLTPGLAEGQAKLLPSGMGANNYCNIPSRCTDAVLDTIAEGHSCRNRIEWLQSVMQMSYIDSCVQVARQEYPVECGLCDPSGIRTCKAMGWGDPHMVTFDGLKYHAQALGEVILSKSLDSDYMIQGRFERFRSDFGGSPTGTFT